MSDFQDIFTKLFGAPIAPKSVEWHSAVSPLEAFQKFMTAMDVSLMNKPAQEEKRVEIKQAEEVPAVPSPFSLGQKVLVASIPGEIVGLAVEGVDVKFDDGSVGTFPAQWVNSVQFTGEDNEWLNDDACDGDEDTDEETSNEALRIVVNALANVLGEKSMENFRLNKRIEELLQANNDLVEKNRELVRMLEQHK